MLNHISCVQMDNYLLRYAFLHKPNLCLYQFQDCLLQSLLQIMFLSPYDLFGKNSQFRQLRTSYMFATFGFSQLPLLFIHISRNLWKTHALCMSNAWLQFFIFAVCAPNLDCCKGWYFSVHSIVPNYKRSDDAISFLSEATLIH